MENDSQHVSAGHVSYSYICMEANSVYEYVFVNIILIAALEKKKFSRSECSECSEEKANSNNIVFVFL